MRDRRDWSRRDVLVRAGSALTLWPLAKLVAACGGATNASTTDAAAPAAAGSDAGVTWATGGTASMTAKAGYPNPFASAATTGCVATGALIQGPCWSSQAEVRQDISYGQPGLPTRTMFQVLDASCRPIAGATVDVWHVSPAGKYSGNDTAHENVAFCTGNDAEYTSHLYFRGKQTTDASGVATFDTCFPGWYPGRTIHVHFTITTTAGKSFTSQYVFDDALCDAIVATQPVYSARGARDTKNTTDTVVSASGYRQFLFETKQMPDGALLAWKAIVLS